MLVQNRNSLKTPINISFYYHLLGSIRKVRLILTKNALSFLKCEKSPKDLNFVANILKHSTHYFHTTVGHLLSCDLNFRIYNKRRSKNNQPILNSWHKLLGNVLHDQVGVAEDYSSTIGLHKVAFNFHLIHMTLILGYKIKDGAQIYFLSEEA